MSTEIGLLVGQCKDALRAVDVSFARIAEAITHITETPMRSADGDDFSVHSLAWLTAAEAAGRLGVSPGAVYAQIRKGTFVAVRHRGVYVIEATTLARYAAHGRRVVGFASPQHPLYGKPRGPRGVAGRARESVGA